MKRRIILIIEVVIFVFVFATTWIYMSRQAPPSRPMPPTNLTGE